LNASLTQSQTGISRFGAVAQTAMLAAGAAIVGFAVSSIKAFSEQEQVMAQTEAVLKSTGGAANLTAEDITNLASRLRELTSIDDEAIQASSNLLLTFREVRNEVGKGNDIFNQAQGAILDMATALNQGAIPSSEELKSATLALGKALNDPITGMTALRRVGVSFNESQRETIQSLVESGDLMGAQKVILRELTKEFGGAAEAAGDTFAGKLQELKNTFEDLQETVGSFAVETLTDFLKGLEQIGGFLNLTGPSLEEVAAQTKVLVTEWQNGTITAVQLQEALQALSDASGDVITIDEELQTKIAALTVAEERRARGTLPDLRGSTEDTTGATDDLTRATERLTEAQREQNLVILAATDSFLAIELASRDLSEAQRELNRLEREGKTDTKAYEEAVLDALTAQISLEEAVFNYGKELADAGQKQGDIIGKLRDMGRELGISRGQVDDLIARIKEYITQINRVPEHVTTTYSAVFQGAPPPGEGPRPRFQHGGVVHKTGLAMVHKGEVFSGVNNEMGFGGGINGDIVLQVNGQTFARITRDELRKLQNRNVTSGI
jgi:hypothetical protein